jgi:hypothetical protein
MDLEGLTSPKSKGKGKVVFSMTPDWSLTYFDRASQDVQRACYS